jgi:alpha-L-rhamnosidase
MRILDPAPPFADHDAIAILWQRGRWPVRWLPLPTAVPAAAAYRLAIDLAAPDTIRLRVTAGERYRLWIDGVEAGVGPERGDERHWRLDAYAFPLSAGRHQLAVQVWALGARAAQWQVPVPGGLLVIGEGAWHERISTGHAPWQVRALDGHDLVDQPRGFFTGPRVVIDGTVQPWGWQTGVGEGFAPARPGGPQPCAATPGTDRDLPMLVPAVMPVPTRGRLPGGMVVLVDAVAGDGPTPAADPAGHRADEAPAWQGMLDGRGSVAVPAGATRRCLIDLGTYRAAWPTLRAAGQGGRVHLHFSEGLYAAPDDQPTWGGDKGDRRQWQGRFVRGVGPAFRLTEVAHDFQPWEWECGRWVEIVAVAGPAPLTIASLTLADTSFPLADEGALTVDDPAIAALRDLCIHTLRVGTHNHYCDCPYYERLQYVGDTRLEVLTTYCLTVDDRLPQRALDDFADARLADGLVPARHPARGTQVIPPFALWWIGMLHDRWLWRDDPQRVRRLLPVARGVLDAWWAFRNADGLIEAPAGWNFVDWVTTHGWQLGMPAGADRGVSAILNWQFVLALRQAADLETAVGEAELATRHRRQADGVAAALDGCFDRERGRYRDAPQADTASEHAQILALLAGVAGERRDRVAASLCDDGDLARTTIYFTHYLFEAYRLLGRGDLLWQRLALWRDLPARGLTTTPEQPEPTRSDCHPWGAHPLYHLAATIAGIRPAAPGFAAATVMPLTVPLHQLTLRIPHPRGAINVDLRRTDGPWSGTVTAPAGVDLRCTAGIVRA